jgi:hypothetical protein
LLDSHESEFAMPNDRPTSTAMIVSLEQSPKRHVLTVAIFVLEMENWGTVGVSLTIFDNDIAAMALRRNSLLRLDHFRQNRSLRTFSRSQLLVSIWHDGIE